MGRGALLVEAGGHHPVALATAVARAAERHGLAVVDIVAGADTVLVVGGGPGVADMLDGLRVEETAPDAGVEVEIPVSYDGEDLAAVADASGLSVEEVVSRHVRATYHAAFAGFAPGFAYLTGLPEELVVGRRAQPRHHVPAGSVAIADRYSAVYPRSTPGGWHLLGTTDAVLFDPDRTPPALITAGTRVRFVEVRRARQDRTPPAPQETGRLEARWSMEVIEAGGLTTVQDRGRAGHGGEGVPPSGAADAVSAALANRLVGNGEEAAVLETTVVGPRLRLRGPTGGARTVAVTGAPAPVRVDGEGRGPNAPFLLGAGQVLEIGPAAAGLRGYVAVAGGFDVPPVLGSRATDVLSGLGRPPLAAGQAVPVGAGGGWRPGVDVAPVPPLADPPVVRLLLGPQADWITREAWRRLGESGWTVSSSSNRVAVRLSGADLERARSGEVAPAGLVTGAVQLTPAGELVVFGPDHPVTGGYPIVAVVDERDLGAVAQLRAGQVVGLRRVG